MRQVFQQSYLDKALCVEEVPAPMLSGLNGPGVLVRNAASLISPGTERAAITFARKGLIAKIRSQPERVQLLLRKMKQNGVIDTLQLAKRKLESPIPLGYSSAGVVIEATPDMPGIRAGDRVACAGAKIANHAEIVAIPKNLCVPLPDNLSFEEGAFVAPGAIALHGVRMAEIGLGETVLVIGLGLIGQLAAQLVQAQGATAIGIDLEPRRLETARQLGVQHALLRSDPGLQAAIAQLTGGRGADSVLIAAATASNDPVTLAGELCRERGKVVIVGDVGMQAPRALYYQKELSLLISRSYGPGRYDERYELGGQDYPAAYVRWSERDNMSAFLQLAAEGRIRLQPLIDRRYDVQDAAAAYDLLADPLIKPQPLGIILRYPSESPRQHDDRSPEIATPAFAGASLPSAPRNDSLTNNIHNGCLPNIVLDNSLPTITADAHIISLKQKAPPASDVIGLGVIGAGSFLTGTLLPILKRQPAYDLRGIAASSGLSAKTAGINGGFAFCASDADAVLQDTHTQAALIATRHDSHADLLCRALEHGKHVFVEKPLAVTREELHRCIVAMQAHPAQQVMVGFNRRFAPHSLTLKKTLDPLAMARPLSIHYRVLAGHIPPEHWVHAHGGRIVGELCHFIDWCAFITGAPPVEGSAQAIGPEPNRDILLQLQFLDGSTAHIEYFMRVSPATAAALGKERITVTTAGLLAEIEDFRLLRTVQGGKVKTHKLAKADKGHAAELQVFTNAIRTGQSAIPPQALWLATEATFAVLDALRLRTPVSIRLPE